MNQDRATSWMPLERVAEALAHRREYDEAAFRRAAERLGIDLGALEPSLAHWARVIAEGLERGDVRTMLRFSVAYARIEHDLRLYRPSPSEVRPATFDEVGSLAEPTSPSTASQSASAGSAATSAPLGGRAEQASALPTYLREERRSGTAKGAEPEGAVFPSDDAITGQQAASTSGGFNPSETSTEETQALPAYVPPPVYAPVANAAAVQTPRAPAGIPPAAQRQAVAIREVEAPMMPTPARMPLRATAAPGSDSAIVRGARLPFVRGAEPTAVKPASDAAPAGAEAARVSSGERGTVAAPELASLPAPLPFAEKEVRQEDVDLSMFPIERYAELSVALADGEDRAAVLRRFVLTEAMWKAVTHAWGARISAEPALRQAFNQAVAQARKR